MTQQEDQDVGQGKKHRQALQALIGDQVMGALGQPADLQQVQVRRLWGGHFRVNVFVGVNAVAARVAHSFFLVADGEGNIIKSTPALTREY